MFLKLRQNYVKILGGIMTTTIWIEHGDKLDIKKRKEKLENLSKHYNISYLGWPLPWKVESYDSPSWSHYNLCVEYCIEHPQDLKTYFPMKTVLRKKTALKMLKIVKCFFF